MERDRKGAVEAVLAGFVAVAREAEPSHRRARADAALQTLVRPDLAFHRALLDHLVAARPSARLTRLLVAMDALEREVANGGFHQYFFNSAGDDARVARDGLTWADAPALAQLEAAMALFDRAPSTDRTARAHQLRHVPREALHALDRAFAWPGRAAAAAALAELGSVLTGHDVALVSRTTLDRAALAATPVFHVLGAFELLSPVAPNPSLDRPKRCVAARFSLATGVELSGFVDVRGGPTGFRPFDVEQADPVMLTEDGRLPLWLGVAEEVPERLRATLGALGGARMFPIAIRADGLQLDVDAFYGRGATRVRAVPYP